MPQLIFLMVAFVCIDAQYCSAASHFIHRIWMYTSTDILISLCFPSAAMSSLISSVSKQGRLSSVSAAGGSHGFGHTLKTVGTAAAAPATEVGEAGAAPAGVAAALPTVSSEESGGASDAAGGESEALSGTTSRRRKLSTGDHEVRPSINCSQEWSGCMFVTL